MKYREIIEKLKELYNQGNNIIKRNTLFVLYDGIYNNNNIKTFENMVGLLKQYGVITDYSKNEYLILDKKLYKIILDEETLKIYKIISSEYKNIKTIVWNTSILNEFTQHYAMKNYIIVETEKYALELVLTLLKEKLLKKYTIITEEMYNQNKNIFLNNENLLIVRRLNTKSPLIKDNTNFLKPTLEKIMVDLYKDRVYEQYQGKELEYIYTNIFEKYNINFKMLYSYAKYRLNLGQYRKFVEKLNK